MGDDTGLAVLSSRPRRLTQFFHEMFAQVTNPPMDPIREKLVMSLRIQLGRRGPLLEDTPQQAHLIELASPILSDAELEAIVRSGDPRFFSHWIATTWPVSAGPEGMEARLDEICDEAAQAVKLGASSWCSPIADRCQAAPIPMLLALGAVHHHLIERGALGFLVVVSEPRDPMISLPRRFRASAVNLSGNRTPRPGGVGASSRPGAGSRELPSRGGWPAQDHVRWGSTLSAYGSGCSR
jgi:hypothetical protein